MIAFADSSALVKIYATEPGSRHVTRLANLVVSELARVEVPAALWRKHRAGELAAPDATLLTSEFEADFFGTHDEEPRYTVVATVADVLEGAAALLPTHGLRAYDAIQLASAVAAREVDVSCGTFVAFDKTLCEAAAREGFTVLPR
jgi:predicted nucleic acid-binding protein